MTYMWSSQAMSIGRNSSLSLHHHCKYHLYNIMVFIYSANLYRTTSIDCIYYHSYITGSINKLYYLNKIVVLSINQTDSSFNTLPEANPNFTILHTSGPSCNSYLLAQKTIMSRHTNIRY